MMVSVLTNYADTLQYYYLSQLYAGSDITTLSIPPNLYLNPYLIVAETEME